MFHLSFYHHDHSRCRANETCLVILGTIYVFADMDSEDHVLGERVNVCGTMTTVVLKNPRALTEENFEVGVSMDMTLGDLKNIIHSSYPGNPCPGSQTLVYAGKVLRDEGLVLAEVFPNDGSRVAVHMVIRHDDSSVESHATRLPEESAGPSMPSMGENPQETVSDPTPVVDDTEQASADVPTTSSSMYDSVLRASYEAALKVIVEQGLQGSAHQSFTFIPAIIPVPRRAVDNRDEEQYLHQYMVPMVPMTYAFPRAQVDRQERGVRRRGAQEQNVRALFEAIREGGNDHVDNLPRRNNQNNNARQIQIRIHLNLRMLLQIAVVSFILYQHCPPSRFLGIAILGFMFYFSTTRFGRMLLQRLTGHFNMQPHDHNQQAHVDNNDTPLQGNTEEREEEAEQGREPEQRQPGLLQEIQSFIAGFFASILPAANQPRNGDNNPAVVQEIFRGQ